VMSVNTKLSIESGRYSTGSNNWPNYPSNMQYDFLSKACTFIIMSFT
jgi:hypothetical protein